MAARHGASDGDPLGESLGRARGNVPGQFRNSDRRLKTEIPRALAERREFGLDGLVGGLDYILVNVEQEGQRDAATEFLGSTGYDLTCTYQCARRITNVMELKGSAYILVSSRLRPGNPYAPFNSAPKARHLPNTRVEKFVFAVRDMDRFAARQRERGATFDGDIQEEDNFTYIQTPPSPCHGTSFGFVHWRGKRGDFPSRGERELDWDIVKPDLPHLRNIGRLDHAALRVKASDRDDSILEFMRMTGYDFDFAMYIDSLNSITNVARLSRDDFAMVFTSGISPYVGRASGPTERYVHNYGPRTHHLAFETERIGETFEALRGSGHEFLTGLIGSSKEGLRQAFSAHSRSTLLVTEYIKRYGGFDGFFAKSNVTELTRATGRQ
jgi:4-hydroxyphenylpyruvate dioxygenase-like putative hemolysin